MNPKPQAYYPGLDAIRGVLIILVVLSHCLSPGIPVFILYSFHMPLFLGIGGFLIKRDFIRNSTTIQILQKYMYRMIIPWFLAVGIYYLWRVNLGVAVDIRQEILYPYFHLWFVPALLGMVVTIKFLEYWNIPYLVISSVGVLLCLGWYVIYREHPQNEVLPWLYYIGDKRMYGYFGFFYLGYLLRTYPDLFPKIKNRYLLLLAGTSLLVLLLFIYFPINRLVSFVPYLVLNISLIYTVISNLSIQKLTENNFILFCNKQSLAIYLYHYLVILIATSFFTITGPLTFILFIITVLATYLTVYLTSSFPFVNKYFFGYTKA